jgi:hypothetical protein
MKTKKERKKLLENQKIWNKIPGTFGLGPSDEKK